MRFRALLFFVALIGAVSIASCSENIEAGGACPLLCPQEAVPLNDTILDAVTMDTSIAGFPAIGFESNLLLAKRADTLDTRIIVRYDSLPVTFTTTAGEGTLDRLDSAWVRGIIPVADTAIVLSEDATIEVYDVTAAQNDTAVSSLAAQFTPTNLLGSLPLPAGTSPDTIIILLDTAKVRNRVANGQSLRVGLRMVAAGSAQIRITSQQVGAGLSLFLKPDRDTLIKVSVFDPKSMTPTDIPRLRSTFGDFNITVVGSAPGRADVLRVGGSPGRRVLLRFNLPSRIVDSATVVRATLILTQRPGKTAQAADSAIIRIAPIVVSNQVTDPYEMLQFAGSSTQFPVDSVIVFPKDSGRRDLQMVNLVRNWRGQDTLKTPRFVALFIRGESDRPAGVDFFSMEAPADVRPRLRLTYVTKLSNGRP